MKPPYLLLGGMLILLSACHRSSDYETTYYPVLMTRDVLEKSVSLHPAATIANPGKLLYSGNYLLVLEPTKGVHVIDNANPQSPVNKGYISIPGCRDFAVKDNVLYADNAVDLVSVDLSAIATSKVTVTTRVKDSFGEMESPDGKMTPDAFSAKSRPANTVVVAWEK